jgi:uncharacterized protein (AIM24 family)
MRSDLFAPQHAEAQVQHPGMTLQNSKMLKIALNGEIMARQGSMVAYQGRIGFEAVGPGGITKFLKQAVTGEGIPLMKASGQGDLFLADAASDVFLIDLEGGHDGLTINGKNVLAFEPSLSWDIRRVQGVGMLSTAGLFNCVFTGRGRIAITCKGTPVVLNVDQPTYSDPQSAVCWSASLQTGFHRADQMGLGTLLGRSTGERFTMAFSGQGFVVVQPSEEVPLSTLAGTGSGNQSGQSGMGGVGGLLGDILGGR